MEVSFDVIGDLYLSPEESFNWENKPTSLYCIVAGNVSSDVRTILQTLNHLCKLYQGVFYIMGPLEYQGYEHDARGRTENLIELCSRIPNLAVLYHHVVIIDGVAIIGCNGWETDGVADGPIKIAAEEYRYEDIAYLKKSIEKIQRHMDVKKVVIVTHAVPKLELYYGEIPEYADDQLPLDFCLGSDTEMKISHWVFGKYEKIVDTMIGSINYLNNPYYKKRPYWAKRFTVVR